MPHRPMSAACSPSRPCWFRRCDDLNLVVLSPKVKGFVNPPEEWFQLWTPWVEA